MHKKVNKRLLNMHKEKGQKKTKTIRLQTTNQERQQGCEPWIVAVIEHEMRLFNFGEREEGDDK